jgi:uncharacterized YceG family protein
MDSGAVRRRRLVAGALVLVVAVAGGMAYAADHGSSKTAAPPAPPPPPHQFHIVFPEGFTRVEMGVRVKVDAKRAEQERHEHVRLAQTTYLAASRHGVVPCFGKGVQKNLEGFLFPATYDFQFNTTSRQLVADQIQTFCERWSGVSLAYARSKNLTRYDVLKIASMVEEEAATQHDRPLIAAVIYNRLRDRIQLGIDATLRYGLHIPPTQSITESELQSNNPYNTRKLYGLPPTPIGNPGVASIEAAAHPAKVTYLYYARIPGTDRSEFFTNYSLYEQYLATHGYGPHP